MTKVDRLLAYLLHFQRHELVRAQELAARFEVSERTVYRDIDALCQVGVPLVGIPGEGYRLLEGYYLPPVMFTLDEARALALALAMLSGFGAQGKTRDSAETAREKISTILPKRLQKQIAAFESTLRFYAFPNPRIDFDDKLFVDLQLAVLEHRLVHIDYFGFSQDQPTTRTIEPLRLVMVNRVWLLSAYCHLRQAVRNFRLDRIEKHALSSQTFEPRALPLNHWTTQRIEVQIRFSAKIARWVREDQHFSFQFEQVVEEGGVVMCYEPAETKLLLGWLMRWGGEFVVVSPAKFRAEVYQVAKAIACRNSGSSG